MKNLFVISFSLQRCFAEENDFSSEYKKMNEY